MLHTLHHDRPIYNSNVTYCSSGILLLEKHIFKQLRVFYTDFYRSFYFKGEYKILVGNIRNATLYREPTCFKIMVCNIPPGGAKPFLAIGLVVRVFTFIKQHAITYLICHENRCLGRRFVHSGGCP